MRQSLPKSPSLSPIALSLQCRSLVTQILLIGPDTRAADGRIIAQVLPRAYWRRDASAAGDDSET
jgi:hypothetical protein